MKHKEKDGAARGVQKEKNIELSGNLGIFNKKTKNIQPLEPQFDQEVPYPPPHSSNMGWPSVFI